MTQATEAPPIEGVLEGALAPTEERSLDPDQSAAVHAPLGRPLLVVAGPGAGKTRVLTQRIIHLVRGGEAAPAKIVAITFTNAAAAEMSERIEAELSADQAGVRISTIHALAAQVVRRHPEVVGLGPQFSIFDSDDQLQLARSVVERAEPGVDAHELVRRIGAAKANLEDSSLWLVRGEAELARAFDLYEADLRAANALDFEGLVRAAALVLSDDRHAAPWRGGIKALLVDEFHDVSEAQFAMIRLLVPCGAGLTAVADDDQIVYAFRGADPEFTVDFERYFPDAAAVTLRRNYRSHGGIVDSALRLIAHNERRRVKELEAADGAGPDPIYEHYDSEEEEAEAIAAWAQSHISSGVAPGQLGVLVRMRGLRVRQDLEITLATRGIPYTTLGERALWARSEVRDALAWLTLTVNPANSAAFSRAVESRPGLGPATARALTEAAKSRGLGYEQICLVPWEAEIGESRGKAAIAFGESMEQIREIARSGRREFKMLVGDIIVLSGIPEQLRRRGRAGAGQLGSVRELFRAARAYQQQCLIEGRRPALAEFLQELTLYSTDTRRTGSSLALGTVHAVKGLEFAHVWVAGLDEGVMPSNRALQEGRTEEERRLAYVALTRARESLVMSSCARRWGKQVKTSRFVTEAGL
ncbi:MAG TPA: ATP-dependent helicase [Solirubrobacterales bacterium]|nr:ATP-dependent helicase [Solirubrobacterales bacterium]